MESNQIRVMPVGDNEFDVTIGDAPTVRIYPGMAMHKIAADLVRLRKLARVPPGSDVVKIAFPDYTLEQLECEVANGTATEEVRREVCRRKGIPYVTPLDRNIP